MTVETTPNPWDETSHPAAIYDPSVHDDQLVAVFATRADAENVLESLRTQGVAGDATVVDQPEAQQTGGFMASLKALFAPDDELTHYSEGLRRGHALLVVHPSPETRPGIVAAMEAGKPIDFDAKLEEWRSAGWANLARQEAATMGAETTAKPGEEAPSASAAAATDTDVRNELEQRAGVAGRRDQSRDGSQVRSYIAPRP